MLGDEVPGALERGAVDPARLKPERVEFGGEHAPHLSDAVEILCSAVDVDDALEQRERLAVVRVDVGGQGALVGRKG